MPSEISPKKHRRAAFTMVELMIVAGIIAILSALAVPAYISARRSMYSASYLNELRLNEQAFNSFFAENGTLPPTSSNWNVVPTGMDNFIPKGSTWKSQPRLGGNWMWFNLDDPRVLDYRGFIGLYGSAADTETIQKIDNLLDDGNLNSGGFLSSGQWLLYGMN